ncbi:Crp/Fnr family transcriptional regulator [Erythrobacter sp. JK5]|uniref:Crp/Fnr family transcriptional regulator n=1 Tax=Erythrobacter sp. JK5 TaxID=2829500 RepID=UPI001BA51B7B|nr:Crp/Fnr family transcriptional regulator [Erythrobacter sp. JK5]QUL37491.1 Crp/Fnr family transcriptional regulator [Erythrobacter sp. JK5]
MSDILHLDARSLTAPMLFSALPGDLQRALEAEASPRSYSAGQIIQQRGERADGFWLIIQGSVAVGQYLADGDFRAVAVLGPGDSWGELAMFAGRPRVVDAVARSVCSLRHVRKEAFEKLLSDHPTAMRPLLGALSSQLQEILDVTAGIRSGSAKARVAGLLATLASRLQLPASIELSQQELGELLGLSRMTVNSALREYEAAGAIRRGYGRIDVIDRTELEVAALG